MGQFPSNERNLKGLNDEGEEWGVEWEWDGKENSQYGKYSPWRGYLAKYNTNILRHRRLPVLSECIFLCAESKINPSRYACIKCNKINI